MYFWQQKKHQSLLKITASSKYATSVSGSQLHDEGDRLTIAAQMDKNYAQAFISRRAFWWQSSYVIMHVANIPHKFTTLTVNVIYTVFRRQFQTPTEFHENCNRIEKTYISFEKIQRHFSLHVVLTLVQTETHIIPFRTVPISIVNLLWKLAGQHLLDFAQFLPYRRREKHLHVISHTTLHGFMLASI